MPDIAELAEHDEAGTQSLTDGTALCLSGGGFRAMVFHVGVLWRLNESGILKTLDRVSSVSGGSITAGLLGLRWTELQKAQFSAQSFSSLIVIPIREFARQNVDVGAISRGAILPWVSIGDCIARAYRNALFGDATLQNLPDHPRFVINATGVQSGVLVRFSKPYLRDYRVGEVKNPRIELAKAVAASSAFPPFLSPVVVDVPQGAVTPGSGTDLEREPYISKWVLSDGGVYDNLGLETAFKRYRTLLVSDAGGKMTPEPSPAHDWARHSKRVLDVIDNQVRSLRKRSLIDAYQSVDPIHKRHGAYWSMRDLIEERADPPVFPVKPGRSQELAAVPTRLKALDDVLQERLMNWGYAISDASMRKYWKPDLPVPTTLPYPLAGI